MQIASMGQSVELVAPESVTLAQSETTLTLKDEIRLNGAQVHLE